tara:strand:- start:207 stop:1076 length:870 start_codon:yes stop_codon:yes gene_type:complete
MSNNNMQQQQANPLSKYFRQPKLFASLPSNGKFYPAGALETTETGEYPIYSMTAKDELTMKTPDALLNGQATVELIKSCVPNIKDPWKLPSIDLDALLIAIRLATYGETMTLSIKTPVTGEEKDMSVNLRDILDNFANIEFEDVVQSGEMTVYLRPLTYQEFTKSALKTFEQQRIFNIVNDEQISDEDKLQAFTNSFAKLTDLTVDMMANHISAIEIGDTRVDNKQHIDEFMKNADKSFYSVIQEHLESQKVKFTIQPLKAQATLEEIEQGVPETYEVPVTFDQSNFFG